MDIKKIIYFKKIKNSFKFFSNKKYLKNITHHHLKLFIADSNQLTVPCPTPIYPQDESWIRKHKQQNERNFVFFFQVSGSMVVVAFQIAFRAEIHANDVFLFFKNHFWYQHIKTIQKVQTALNFSKKKKKI